MHLLNKILASYVACIKLFRSYSSVHKIFHHYIWSVNVEIKNSNMFWNLQMKYVSENHVKYNKPINHLHIKSLLKRILKSY